MANISILVSNTSFSPIEVHWGYVDSIGNYKERIELIRDRAINFEIKFSSEKEKAMFLEEKKHLFESKKLILGKQNDKAMQKAKEEKDKKESKKTKEVQQQVNESVQNQVNEITHGEVPDFEVQAVKSEAKK